MTAGGTGTDEKEGLLQESEFSQLSPDLRGAHCLLGECSGQCPEGAEYHPLPRAWHRGHLRPLWLIEVMSPLSHGERVRTDLGVLLPSLA